MSNEENSNQTEEPVSVTATAAATNEAKKAGGFSMATLLELKEKNPKVFFGAIGGVVALLVIVMALSGSDNKEVQGPVMKNLVVGQKYVLKSANAYDPGATVRLVPVPGSMEAYDDTEEADRSSSCQHIAQGTPVTILALQDMYGKKNAFAKVQMDEGNCKGRDGWALGIDVQ